MWHRHGEAVDKSGAVNTVRGGVSLQEGRGHGGKGVTLDEDATKALVRQGHEAGFLTQEEVALVLDEVELDTVQVHEFYKQLDELHIDVDEGEPEEEDEPTKAQPDAAEVSTDSLQLFLKDIGKVPLLTAAQEVELSKRIELGDHRAKQQMVEANLRLVVPTRRNTPIRARPSPTRSRRGPTGPCGQRRSL